MHRVQGLDHIANVTVVYAKNQVRNAAKYEFR